MPGPHGRPPMDMKNMKNMDTKSLGRVFSYLFKNYTVHLIIVVICIIITAITTLYGMLFMKSLVDDYITPLVNDKAAGLEPDFGPLAGAILKLIGIYAAGIVTSYAYNRIMVNVSQGSLRNLRNDLFSHMETLPIKYFDTHAHGDIMSIYTNDIDTLRQLIGQSIPQLINSVITVLMSFASMIVLNIPLTILTVLMVGVMFFVSAKLGGKSSAFFIKQQKDLGKVNGYIEEMLEGQKVVKVFCHEEKAKEGFNRINDELRASAENANKFANILMPIANNLGHISYVLRARKALKNGKVRAKKNTNDFRRFITTINCTKEGEIAEKKVQSIDEDYIRQEERFDGFYAVSTNLADEEPSEIAKANHQRWQIEQCFRIMKSEFRSRPVYVRKDNRIKAHFLTCFLALVIYRYLEKGLNGNYSCEQLCDTLRKMNVREVLGEGYIPTYTRTDITDALHEKFGFRTDYQIITKENMKKTIGISQKNRRKQK